MWWMARKVRLTRYAILDGGFPLMARHLPAPARPLAVLLALAVLVMLTAATPGCKSRGTVVTPGGGVIVPFDGPSVLRGTVGASATLVGADPVLVGGLGVVVGVRGRGGPLRPDIEATIIRDLSLREGARGVDLFYGTMFEGESAESFLRRSDVAVVALLALVAPGAPRGSTFDVLVFALNNEDLSGGQLWRTDMRLGRPAVQGALRARQIGFAQGQVYVNPFATGSRANPSQGRVIGGGVMTNPLELAIRLNVPSPRRARAISQLINARFGSSPLERGDIAGGRLVGRGEAESSLVTLRIPWEYKDRPGDFLRLVANINPDAEGREERTVGRYIQAMKEEPAFADRIAWALEAMGPVAIEGPTNVGSLYEWPEIAPRLAALRVGARLGDPRAERPLVQLARSGNPDLQIQALELLGELGIGPMIDATLQDLAGHELVSVRVAAYEAMVRRAGMRELRSILEQGRIPPGVDRVGVLRDWSEAARRQFRGNASLGLQRDIMPGGFVIDRVPIGKPLMFLRQQGTAGLVIFGEDLRIEPGSVLRLEDGEFLMARAEAGSELSDPSGRDVRIRYRHRSADWLVTVPDAPSSVVEFIEFLATKPTIERPLGGLGLNFGQIVTILSRLSESGAIKAQWQVERSILREGVDRQTRGTAADRPETDSSPETGIDPLQDYLRRTIEGGNEQG